MNARKSSVRRPALITGSLLVSLALLITPMLWRYWAAPPSEFAPVPATDADVNRRGCPDLLGSYRAANGAELDFLGEDGPDTFNDSPRILTLKASPHNGYAYTWRAAGAALDRAAEILQARNPEAHIRWRKLIMREELTEPQRVDRGSYYDAILAQGPLPERSGQLTSSGCRGGWMEVYHFDSVGRSASGEYDRSRRLATSISLARDRNGALLIRNTVRNVTQTNLFRERLETPSRTSYRKLEPTDDVPAAWLPSAAALASDVPGQARIDARVAALMRLPMLQQRLVNHLPPDTRLDKFLLHGTATSIKEAADDAPTQLSFAGTLGPNQDVGQLIAVMEAERADIADFEIVDLRVDPERRTHFELLLSLRTEEGATPQDNH